MKLCVYTFKILRHKIGREGDLLMNKKVKSPYLSQVGNEVVLFLNYTRNGFKYWSIVSFSATNLQGYASGVARTFSLVGHNGMVNYYPVPPYHPVSVLNRTS